MSGLLTSRMPHALRNVGDGEYVRELAEIMKQNNAAVQNTVNSQSDAQNNGLLVVIPNSNELAAYRSAFEQWYMENIFIISLVQWAFIFLIILKLSKQN